VHSARSGGEALELVKAENFEIAVVDLNLGDMSGTAVLETLASKHPHGQVRIAISGADDALAAVRPHVAQAIFRKPIDIEEFVTSLVENARAM
jgi:CheY-like chemotaxis protein